MRGYFVSAFRNIAKIVPHPSVIRTYVVRHRASTFVMAAMLLLVTTSALLVAKHLTVAALENVNSADISSASEPSPDVTTPQTVSGVHISQQVTNTVSPSGKTHTSFSVNNQSIPVPANGSVHKTFHSDNGTTNVDMTVNGSSTNSNISSTSTNLQVMSSSTAANQNSEFHTP